MNLIDKSDCRLEQVYENADFYYELAQRRTESKILEQADSVYFLGIGTPCFWLRAPIIASKLPNFSGLIGGLEEKRLREFGRFNFLKFNSKIIDIEEVDRSKKTVLVDFNQSTFGRILSKSLESKFEVVNWLQASHDLDLYHTYLPLKVEREETYANIDAFQQIDEVFADDFSRSTLRARIQSLLSMDPFYLQEFQTVAGIVQKNNSQDHLISVDKNEDFVDVGAHDGDTVREFVNSVGTNYGSITAYEPDKRSFKKLKFCCDKLPRAEAYNYAVSDFNGEVNFYQNKNHSLGSRIALNLSRQQQTEVCSCIKLDDHIKKMSLFSIDVEGHEVNVIEGARGLIEFCQPKMHVSAYHYPLDIVKIVSSLKTISKRNMFLRHQTNSLFDTNVIVV